MIEPSMVEILTSKVLPTDGFVHGFPTRRGGVSAGKRASLNLGYRWGDDEENVLENRRRVARSGGFALDRLHVTKHVHGTNVWVVGDPVADPAEFDGLVSGTFGDTLGAFAADCIPMLFADPVRHVVAAAHAGWRGTVAGVGVAVVNAMKERFGVNPADIRVAIGPSIGPCCFEVGSEVVEVFERELPNVPGLFIAGPRKLHVDLHLAARVFLERAGARREHIDANPPCTKCDPERFFSFRRDGQEGGVHMAFIGLRARGG